VQVADIRRFFRWWGKELTALLPNSVRHLTRTSSERLRLVITDSELVAVHETGEHSRELGRTARRDVTERFNDTEDQGRVALSLLLAGLDPAKTAVTIELAPAVSLVKALGLPLAAEENLRQVLAYELERQTPFWQKDVYFDHRLVDRKPEIQQITVKLGVALRRIVDDALSLLDGWDLQPAASPAEPDPEWSGRTFAFLPAVYRTTRMTRLTTGLAGANILLLVALVIVPLVSSHAELNALQQRLEAVMASATAATELRERIDQSTSQIDFVLDEKARWPASVEILNELTRLLPDDTWLSQLDLQAGSVELKGISRAASSLIALLEESDMLRDVRFSSPVTLTGGGERFHVTATISPKWTIR
jgi:general secretion pathway protein L